MILRGDRCDLDQPPPIAAGIICSTEIYSVERSAKIKEISSQDQNPMMHTASSQDVSQIFNTFHHLVQELKPFVKVEDLKVAFDSEGTVYLQGDDFQEQIRANFTLSREVRNEIRNLIAKYRSNDALNMKTS